MNKYRPRGVKPLRPEDDQLIHVPGNPAWGNRKSAPPRPTKHQRDKARTSAKARSVALKLNRKDTDAE